MDLTFVGIAIGFILAGLIAGIPIGQALEHKRLIRFRSDRRTRAELTFGQMKTPMVFTKEEISDLITTEVQ